MDKTKRIAVGIVSLALLAVSSFFLVRGFDSLVLGQQVRAGSWLTIADAARLADDYLVSLGNKDLAIDEIMEFEYNFYVFYYEKSTGMGAFEAIIDKTGAGGMMGGGMMRMMGYSSIRPEQGPNMMWNAKYGMNGMMGIRSTLSNLTITESQARQYAHTYLDANYPGATTEDVHPFYGYYTIHLTMNGNVFGMLSVNSYSGQVWYHNWHGQYILTLEVQSG